MTEVLVVGCGPAGMMLAGELALAGIDVTIVERRATGELIGSRAGGFHARTIEILDQRGIADRFLAAGTTVQTARFGATTLDISDFPTRHPYGLALWQNEIEPLLAAWIAELGVRVERGREVVGLDVSEADRVEARFRDGRTMHASYLVGADGGRSVVRKGAGIDFPGIDATRSNLIAEVRLTAEPPAGVRQDETGTHGLQLLADGLTYRVVTTEQQLGPSSDPTLADLSAALQAVYGTDFGAHDPTSITRFTDATRQAATYRQGRVLLVGDAAHIHYPAGGQGIGLGIQDAVNLGWKLAQVAKGVSPESLLDSYHAERHPVDARALRFSMAQTVLQRVDARTAALTETIDDLLQTDAGRRMLGARIHGLDLVYETPGEHPLVGRRMPDLDLETATGATRVSELLHEARPVLLTLGDRSEVDLGPWSDRVKRVAAHSTGRWEVPVLGAVPPLSAALIRPDGHVAWAEIAARADRTADADSDAALTTALSRWFGSA